MKCPVHDKECRDHHLDGMKNELDNGTERENGKNISPLYALYLDENLYSIYNKINFLPLFYLCL